MMIKIKTFKNTNCYINFDNGSEYLETQKYSKFCL